MSRVALVAVLVTGVVATCAAPAPPSSAPVPSATAAVPDRPASPAASISVDASLLDLLPPEVDGTAVAFSEEASAEVAADPALAANIESIAYGVAAAATEQLLIVAVSRLRQGVFGDGFFRTWRADYDREVCAQAGGVRDGSAQAEIDGRHVFIGSCANGGNTYHVWLAGRRTIVSAVSFGDRRLGERLMESLGESAS